MWRYLDTFGYLLGAVASGVDIGGKTSQGDEEGEKYRERKRGSGEMGEMGKKLRGKPRRH